MEPLWSKAKENAELPWGLKAIVNDAKAAGYWIYNKVTKKWYTPEELKEGWHGIFTDAHGRQEGNGREFVIADPRRGLKLRIETLQKVAKEVQDFQARIDLYYDLKKK